MARVEHALPGGPANTADSPRALVNHVRHTFPFLGKRKVHKLLALIPPIPYAIGLLFFEPVLLYDRRCGWVTKASEMNMAFVTVGVVIILTYSILSLGALLTVQRKIEKPRLKKKFKWFIIGLALHFFATPAYFINENGIGIARGAVGTGNIAGQRSFTRLGRRWHAEARYLEILWWRSWKERPLADSAKRLLGA